MSNDPQLEAEANYFAMHLLVPDALLKQALRDLPPFDLSENNGLIDKLAKRFGVSNNVIAFRLTEIHEPKL